MKQLISILIILISLNSFSQNTVKIISGGGGFTTVDTTSLSNRINLKEPIITASNTALKYWTGFKTWGNLLDSARTAISLTTTGSSGAATYNNSTGVLNIPQYSGGGGSGWSTSGNTNPAEPDSSVFLGTLNPTSLRLQTNGKNRILIDSNGIAKFTNTSPYQIALHRSGQYGTSGQFFIGDDGDGAVTQNPSDNVRIMRYTGVLVLERNLRLDDNTLPASEYLEHDGSGAYFEVGEQGLSAWASDFSTAGTHNLKLVTQAHVNGNFGIGVGTGTTVPIYKLHVSDVVTSVGVNFYPTSGSYGQIVFTDTSSSPSQPATLAKTNTVAATMRNYERWRISNMSKLNGTIPNIFGIEQGRNLAGATINQYRFLIGDNGNVGIGTQTEPNASAKLEITSTTSGLLLPRMTKAQRDAISSPENGLLLYQTDGTAGVKARIGGAWYTLNTTADP